MRLFRLLSLIFLILVCASLALAQGQTATLDGTVKDPTGATIADAQVAVTNSATGAVFKTTSDARGHWAVPSMSVGTYRVSVSKDGFSTKTIERVSMNAGVPATVNVELELGQVTQTVEVSAGAEIVQTSSATVSNTITGRQVVELPYYSRNATELITMMPGTSTPTSPRNATVNGLPQGALNITIDGINTQDNLLKSSNGNFSYIMPSTDSLEEVTMSSGAGSVDATAQGAAQMKYITKSGSNSLHGGAFWQNRNQALEANTYFNNQNGNPRNIINLNQGGFHVGGPIKKDKAFFFVNYEIYRLPLSAAFSRTFLTDNAMQGNYTYMGTDKQVHTVNLFQLAAAANAKLPAGTRAFPTTADPTMLKTVQQMAQLSRGGGGTVQDRIATNSDYNRMNLNYMPSGMSKRRFLTTRLDYNVTSKNVLSFVWNHDRYESVNDVLNSVVPVFPGTGAVMGSSALGDQGGRRFDGIISLRSTISPMLTNELRAGVMGGITIWDSQIAPSLWSPWKGYNPYFCSGVGSCSTSYISSIQASVQNPQRRNSPTKNVSDTVTWVKGKHQLSFGGSFDQVSLFNQMMGTESIPYMYIGAATGDPLVTGTTAAFANTTAMPGSSSGDWTNAANLYSILTGRVYQISTRNVLDEKTKQYTKNPYIERDHIREFGIFAQDTWRLTPAFTVSAGLRWEKEMPFVNTNGLFSAVDMSSLYGVSGVGNMFAPGYMPGSAPVFQSLSAIPPYKIPAVWAPGLGIAWQLPTHDGFLGKLLGNHRGATVLRVGYSISTVREGLNSFSAIYGSNVGLTQDATISPTVTPGDFGPAGSVMFGDANIPARSGLVTSPKYPLLANPGDSLNAFDPNLKMGYVQSWNIGLQRELGQNTVVEVRYTGNHGTALWRQVDLNEVNVFENGFLKEFQVATQNLLIARQALGVSSNNFGNQGLPGQQNIPIMSTALNGATNDSTMAGYMLFPGSLARYGQVGSAANRIARTATYMNRLVAAGYPKNFFLVNPDVYSGDPYIINNTGSSYYDALQVEVRRRLAGGLMVQASYEFGKSLMNGAAASSYVYAQPFSLRDLNTSKMPTTWDLRNQIKMNYIYELPFGPGKRFLSHLGNPVLRKAVEGWEIAGMNRLQSGSPFQITNGTTTFNTQAGGIALHNITPQQLQDAVKIVKTSQFSASSSTGVLGILYYLPADFINNTKSAWNYVSPMLDSNYKPVVVNGVTQTTGINQLDPTKPYIGPAAAGTQGWLDFYLRYPWMQFWNFSLVKRTSITERANLEIRAQALNAFNRTNFNGFSGLGSSLGQVTGAYSDTSNTSDPGSRVVEFVVRLNF